ncbi:MAG: hypothetical protein MI866_19240 [Bacteroidales bacterium]|nr:hypothetical protein [Bacteroidales bacterium]
MKNKYLVVATALLITCTTISAQRNQKQGYRSPKNAQKQECRINNLTDEQKDYIKQERVKFQSEIQVDRNKLGELTAQKRTLETTEPVNQKNLDKVLAEINTVKTNMAKKKVRHQQAIKSQLNDEQLVAFEQFVSNKGRRMGKGHGPEGRRNFDCSGNADCPQMQGRKKGHRGNAQGNMNSKQGQGRRGYGRNSKYMLSEELQEQLKTARLDLMKQQQPLNNQLNELKAQYKSITYGKEIDLKKVDKNLDEQASLQLKLAKMRSKHKLAIRSKLSDEEKIWFDRQQMHRMHGRQMN